MRKFTIHFLVVLFGLHWSSNAQTFTFTCPTTTTTWTVPAGVTSVLVDVIGATGQRNSVDAVPFAGRTLIHRPGNGARVQATLAVTPGQVLNIYVGGTPLPSVISTVNIGGFNGGGNSDFAPTAGGTPNISGGGGGGASDIRIGGTALANRVIVAGGGGGAGGNYYTPPGTAPVGAVINTDRGGDGGGTTGEAGSAGTIGAAGSGLGGTPTAGGTGGVLGGIYGNGGTGVLGVGGNGGSASAGGGGGGGYWGGGGGCYDGAGGGSSYTDAVLATAVTHTRGHNAAGCGSVVITVPCTTPAVSGVTTVCAGATTNLSSTTAGGTWTSATTSVATVNLSSGVVTGVAGGTSLITYTVAGGCSATTLVTVNPLPSTGTITGITTVCPAATTQLSDPIAGGVWSSVSTGVATISPTGLVTGVSGGTSIISYTVTNGCGTAAATTLVTVNPPNAGSITGITTVCPATTTQLTDLAAGGVWSSVSTGVATVSATGLVTGVSAGTSVISYTVTNVCGTVAATALVTVSPVPFAGSISGVTIICPTITTQLNDPAPGGVWSSVSTGVATVNATGVVTGVSVGTSVISYTVTNSCGTAVATTLVTVNPSPNTGTITGITAICPMTTTQLTNLAAGGVWSSAPPSVATITSTGLVTGVSTGSSIISYTVTNSCGTAAATMLFTVLPTNAGTITGTTTVCEMATTQLTDLVVGGIWSSVSTGVATISSGGLVTGVSPGTSVISYTITNICGTVYATTVVTVNPLPVAGSITGPTTVCVPATISLTDGTTGGVWSSSPTSRATVNASGVVTGVAAGNVTISSKVTNSCGTAVATHNVSVVTPGSVGPITGGTKVCAGETLQLSNAVPGGQWGTTAAPIAAIDIATGLVSGLSQGVAAITYLIPICDFPYATVHVTVYSFPPTPVIVASGNTLRTTLNYAGYQWFRNGTPIPGATNATYNAVVTGLYSVVVNNAGDCEATSAGITIFAAGVSDVNESDIDIKIYPNPATKLLMISASEKIDISILSVDGKELITQKDATQTDVSNLVPGMYMIKIYNQDGVLVKVATFVKK